MKPRSSQSPVRRVGLPCHGTAVHPPSCPLHWSICRKERDRGSDLRMFGKFKGGSGPKMPARLVSGNHCFRVFALEIRHFPRGPIFFTGGKLLFGYRNYHADEYHIEGRRFTSHQDLVLFGAGCVTPISGRRFQGQLCVSPSVGGLYCGRLSKADPWFGQDGCRLRCSVEVMNVVIARFENACDRPNQSSDANSDDLRDSVSQPSPSTGTSASKLSRKVVMRRLAISEKCSSRRLIKPTRRTHLNGMSRIRSLSECTHSRA